MRRADPVLTVTAPGCKPDVGRENTGKPDDVKASCPVWGGAEGEELLTQYLACGLLHQVIGGHRCQVRALTGRHRLYLCTCCWIARNNQIADGRGSIPLACG